MNTAKQLLKVGTCLEMLNHGSEKPFKCNNCAQSLKHKEYLKKHQTVHLKMNHSMQALQQMSSQVVYSYSKCKTCESQFTQKAELTQFKCKMCNSSYKQKNNKMTHAKFVLKATKINSLQCRLQIILYTKESTIIS